MAPSYRHKCFYLSGGMEYAPGEGMQWRASLQQWLEGELEARVFNPNVESDLFLRSNHPGVHFRQLKSDDIESFKTIAGELVARDCSEIAERTDLVICHWDDSAMRGAGTKGELTVAKYFQKPVFMVTAIAARDIPAWVLGCTSRIFPSFEALQSFLIAED